MRGQKMKKIYPFPWICPEAIKWLKSNLTPDMKVFEFGSGGSTLFFAKRVKELISIEHDPVYFIRIRKFFSKLNFIPELKEYSESISKYPDKYFDLVFVDGMVRNDCIKNAIPKVKGYLILDNSEIEAWQEGVGMLKEYESQTFRGIPVGLNSETQTTIFKIR